MKVEWIETINRLPEDGQSIIHYSFDGGVEAGYYDAGQEVFIIGVTGHMGRDKKNVSHWMPFPDAPE